MELWKLGNLFFALKAKKIEFSVLPVFRVSVVIFSFLLFSEIGTAQVPLGTIGAGFLGA